MIRNFVAGALWGGVVAGLGLGVISQVTPMPGMAGLSQSGGTPAAATPVAAAEAGGAVDVAPKADGAAPKPAVIAAADAPMGVEPVDPAPAAVDQAEPAVPAEAGSAEAVIALAPATPAPATPAPATPAPEVPQPVASDTAPAAPKAPDAVENAPDVAASADAIPKAATPEALPQAGGAEPAVVAADLPPPPLAQAEEHLLEAAPVPAVEPAPALITPDPAPAPEVAVVPEALPDAAAPETLAPDTLTPDTLTPDTLAPSAALKSEVAGVTTGRLPRIGDAAQAVDPSPIADDAPPIVRFARAFQNDSGKPLFAVILRDTGAADVDRAKLAALPFPISFVVDPLAENAADAATIYRAAGQEVLMLASGIPDGAQASDLEQTFQAHGSTLPDAVAVVDLAAGGFQDNRPLATQVVPLIKLQGRGLITFDRGLNAADQVARREDVPSATIFRQLDAEGEDAPVIRRYLDRAAFKAAQEGRVMVLGDTRAETIAALMEWTVEGRASSVTLAPATAVMAVQ